MSRETTPPPGQPPAKASDTVQSVDAQRDAALAALAFASDSGPRRASMSLSRHLALLPLDALDLDLDDPLQRDFGDYELTRKLGQGGMGVVYQARQKSLDRDVAIKLLAAGPWASPNFIARFKLEAQSAARMQHPNIVAIYEIDTFEELNFFSMRLVHGPSLASVLAEHGPMAPRAAARLVRTIAEALDYAHRMGVLHLDLKPGNVLIDERGEPQVADFGLARRLDDSLSAVSEEVSGTPSYMAPEQAIVRGHKLSPATDIHGLGAILYECLAGHPPFVGSNAQDTLRQLVSTDAEPLRKQHRRIPADLDAICLKCLAKDPGQRYRSARELADDLGRFGDDRPVSVRPLNALQRMGFWIRREPRLAGLVGLLLLSLLIGLGTTSLQWQRSQQHAASARSLLWEGRRETATRLEQAGKGLAAAPRLLANIVEREAAGEDSSHSIERSHLGMLLSQGVTLIDAMLLADANPLAAEVSPDGRLLAVALNDLSVRWYDTRTLTEQGRIDLGEQPTSEGFAKVPALLRFVDNRRLRVTLEWYSHQISPSDTDSFLVDLERQALLLPPAAFADLADASYSSDGGYALLRNRRAEFQLWQVDPWKPLSELHPAPTTLEQKQPWILGRGGHFAAYTLHASQTFELRDPRSGQPLPLRLPEHAGITAWAESADGQWLALGDSDGRMLLVDLRAMSARLLPAPRGQDISWLAFSEDDSWLAACGLDGAVHAFDVASGDPLASGQIREAFELRRVSIDRRQRLLIAAGVGQLGLWRLPEPSPQALAARRLRSSPAREELAGQFALGWSLQSGLLVSAGVEGQVRLWRLPASSQFPAQTSRLLAGSLHFDGKRIVDVAFDQLRIASLAGLPLTPWLQLPRAPGFAELADRGTTLVVSVGPQLRVYDSTTLRERVAAIELPATPQNLTVSADASVAVVSFGGAGVAGFQERIEVIDLVGGRRQPGSAVVAGPLRQLEFSADASRILATGPRGGATTVYATGTLEALGEYPHEPDSPVVWAAFAPAADSLLLALRVDDARQQDDALVSWNYLSDSEILRVPLPHLGAIGVAASARGALAIGASHDVFDPGGSAERVLERMSSSPASVGFAASADGRLLARSFFNEVQLYDAQSLAPVGPPLMADTAAGDVLARLAFAPDSRHLLARGIQGGWYLWPVAADTRPTAEIAQDLLLLRDSGSSDGPRRSPTPAERARLRSHDPGAWLAAEARPAARYARVVNGAGIPARAAGTDPLLLDLTASYNIAPVAYLSDRNNMIATQRYLGSGVQRIDGIDYDIRGSAQLINALGGQVKSAYTAERAPAIAVPPLPIAAFHVLLFAGHRSGEPQERVYAQLRVHYRDGGSVVLPLRTRREVPGWTENDGPVPFGWAYGDLLRASGGVEQILISNPRLPNPQPQRIIESVELEAGAETWNMPVFLAVTAEPVIAPGESVTPEHTASTQGR